MKEEFRKYLQGTGLGPLVLRRTDLCWFVVVERRTIA